MEPVIAFNVFNSMRYMTNAVNTFVFWIFRQTKNSVKNGSIECRYRNCTFAAYWLRKFFHARKKEAYTTGRPIREIILEKGLLTKAAMDHILSPAK